MRAFAIAAVLGLLTQDGPDEARIRQLVEKLNDDSIKVREQAQADLIAAGEAVVPHLEKLIKEASEASEPRSRARVALRRIEARRKVRGLYREGKPITLDMEGVELGKVLEEIGRQGETRIHPGGADPTLRVSVKVKGATLLEVLDGLCGDDRSYRILQDGITFNAQKHVGRPSAYAGPFRIQVAKVRLERETDYASERGNLVAWLRADSERPLAGTRPWHLTVTDATDAAGKKLEAVAGEETEDAIVRAFGGRAALLALAPGRRAPEGQAFTLKAVSAEVRAVTLQGKASFFYPLSSAKVEFVPSDVTHTEKFGEYAVKFNNLTAGSANFYVSSPLSEFEEAPGWDVDRRVNGGTAVAVDEEGLEFEAKLCRAEGQVMGPGSAKSGIRYQAMFDDLIKGRPRKIVKLRLELVSELFEISVPFEIRDVRIP